MVEVPLVPGRSLELLLLEQEDLAFGKNLARHSAPTSQYLRIITLTYAMSFQTERSSTSPIVPIILDKMQITVLWAKEIWIPLSLTELA